MQEERRRNEQKWAPDRERELSGAEPAGSYYPPEERGHSESGLPDLSQRTVSAVFDRIEDAEAAMNDLVREGWDPEAIAIVQTPAGTPAHLDAGHTQSYQGLLVGAGIGAVIGAVLGLLVAMFTPAADVFVTVPESPLTVVLFVAAAGAAAGALVGSLIGLTKRRPEAIRHSQAVRQGGCLMTIRTSGPEEAQQACRMLNRLGARSVNAHVTQL